MHIISGSSFSSVPYGQASAYGRQWAWPNPSAGPVNVLCNVPPSAMEASLRVTDLNGRLVKEQTLPVGRGIAQLAPGFAAPGIYLAELRLDGIRAGQVKLVLQ